ncbi:hypothetical protein L6Q96_05555 [Candidatus Binatia bacterium]|nr:hypothetical protein [Candidatus Binatia bacterium]
MTGREAVLEAFDRLFERAVLRLRVECAADEREEARQHFLERFDGLLALADQASMPSIPNEVMEAMEAKVDQVSPAQLAGYLAAIPLVQETAAVLQRIAYLAAEQRLLEHVIGQADGRYGGN